MVDIDEEKIPSSEEYYYSNDTPIAVIPLRTKKRKKGKKPVIEKPYICTYADYKKNPLLALIIPLDILPKFKEEKSETLETQKFYALADLVKAHENTCAIVKVEDMGPYGQGVFLPPGKTLDKPNILIYAGEYVTKPKPTQRYLATISNPHYGLLTIDAFSSPGIAQKLQHAPTRDDEYLHTFTNHVQEENISLEDQPALANFHGKKVYSRVTIDEDTYIIPISILLPINKIETGKKKKHLTLSYGSSYWKSIGEIPTLFTEEGIPLPLRATQLHFVIDCDKEGKALFFTSTYDQENFDIGISNYVFSLRYDHLILTDATQKELAECGFDKSYDKKISGIYAFSKNFFNRGSLRTTKKPFLYSQFSDIAAQELLTLIGKYFPNEQSFSLSHGIENIMFIIHPEKIAFFSKEQIEQLNNLLLQVDIEKIDNRINPSLPTFGELPIKVLYFPPPLYSPIESKANIIQRLKKRYRWLEPNQTSFERGLRNAANNGMVEDLIDFIYLLDGKINAQDVNSNKTALHWAAEKGHIKCCLRLIEKNADLSIQDNTGSTALHLAAKAGHLNCYQHMKDYDVYHNSSWAPDKDGKTAEDYATVYTKELKLTV